MTVAAAVAVAAWPVSLRAERVPPRATGTSDVTVDVTAPAAWTAVPDAAATTPVAAGTTEPARALVVSRRAPPAPATTAVTAEAGFWPA